MKQSHCGHVLIAAAVHSEDRQRGLVGVARHPVERHRQRRGPVVRNRALGDELQHEET